MTLFRHPTIDVRRGSSLRVPRSAFRVFTAAAVLSASAAALAGPPGAVSDLYVPSGDTHSVKQFDGVTGGAAGTFVATASGGLNNPVGIAFGPSGNLFVTSYNNDQVIQYDGNTGALIGTFSIGGGLDGPYGIAFGSDGNLYACSFLNARVVRFDGTSGAALGTFATGGGLGSPMDLTFGPGGELYVSSFSGSKVLRFNGTSGAFVSTFATGGGLSGPAGLTFGPNGNLFVASFNNNQIIQFDGTTGAAIGVFASGGGLAGPFGITFGPDGNLYVASYNNDRVLRYSGTNGAFIDAFIPTVTNPGNVRFKTASGPFPAPDVTAFSPNVAANCGPTSATIDGTGFAAGIGFKLKQAGQTDIAGAITALSGTQATVSFNLAGAALGLWDVEARYPDGQSDVLAGVLTLAQCAPPTVTGFSPGSASNCGPLNGAVISGSDFLAGATVKLSRAGQSDIPGTNVLVTPPGTISANFAITGAAVGLWDVTVTNPAGLGSHTLAGALDVSACPPPTVSGINPNSISNCGALNGATISGSSILAGATVKLARTGQSDIPGTGVVVTPPGTITANFATTGAAPGAWDVVVTNPGASGIGTLPGGLNITACPPPVVTGFSPGSVENCSGATTAGTITGSAFLSGATVKLVRSGQTDINGTSVVLGGGGTNITASFLLTGTVAGFWDVVVTNPGASGSGTLPNAVNVITCPPPVITSFLPVEAANCRPMNWNSGAPGVGVRIFGTGLRNKTSARLRRDGQPDIIYAPTSSVDFPVNSILPSFMVTDAAPGDWELIVTNPDGQSSSLPNALELAACPAPIVSAIDPPGAIDTATSISFEILGSDLIYSTTPSTVTLRRAGAPDIVAVANFGPGSSARAPDQPILGTFNVAGAAAGRYDVVLTRADGQSSTLPAAFLVSHDPGVQGQVIGCWGGQVRAVYVDPAAPDIAYVGSGHRLLILNVADPANIVELGELHFTGLVSDIKVRGTYAYVTAGVDPFTVVDVANPGVPQRVAGVTGSQLGNNFAGHLELWGNYAYMTSPDIDVRAVNIADPLHPTYAGTICHSMSAFTIRAGVLYVNFWPFADWDMLRLYDLNANPTSPPLLGSVSLVGMGNREETRIVVDGSHAYVTHLRSDANHGMVVDVSNPASPVVVHSLAPSYSSVGADAANGLWLIGNGDGGEYNFGSWNLNPGLEIYSVSNPAAPVLLTTFKTHGIVRDARIFGTRAYLMDSGEGLIIADISNPANPVRIGSYFSPATLRRMDKVGDLLYVTDIWNGFAILDVSNPAKPQLVGRYQTPQNGSHMNHWGIAVRDGLAYFSAGWSGLQVVDVTSPNAPNLVGGFPFGSGLSATAIELDGDIAHVGVETITGGGFLVNFDIGDFGNIVDVGFIPMGGPPHTISTNERGVTYLARAPGTTKAIDNSDLNAPISITDTTPGGELVRDGDLIFATADSFVTPGLYVRNVDNPASAAVMSSMGMFAVTAVERQGRLCYINGTANGGRRLRTIDMSDPSAPITLADTAGEVGYAEDILADGPIVYATNGATNGMGLGGLLIYKIGVPGDFNSDLRVDSVDLSQFVSVLLGITNTSAGRAAADVNNDGAANGLDIRPFIQRYLSEVPPPACGACCLPDGSCQDGVAQPDCVWRLNGEYHGDGSVCAGVTCPPIGACCIPFGNQPCLMHTQAACVAQGGTYHGDGMPCETVACRGACCNSDDGSCHERSSAACAVTDGIYQGDGVTCASSSCPYGRYSNEANPIQFFRASGDGLTIADDMTLAGTGARELDYLDIAVYGNGGGDFDVFISLHYDCPFTGTPIPGAEFALTGVPDDGFAYILDAGVVPPGIILSDTVWMAVQFSTSEAGWLIAQQAEIGSTADVFGTFDATPEYCNASFLGGVPYAGFWANLRCQPSGALTTRGQWNKPAVPEAGQSQAADAPKAADEPSASPRFIEHKGRQYRVINRMKKLEGAGKPMPVAIQPRK